MAVSTIEKPVAAKGLSRERLVEISSMPDRERPTALYLHLCEEVLGRKKAPQEVVYWYGFYGSDGKRLQSPRTTRTEGVDVPAGYSLNTAKGENHMPRQAFSQPVKGSYRLDFDLNDGHPPVTVTMINGRPGELQFNNELGKYVQLTNEEVVNIERGIRTVDTRADRFLFCFLELHPANFNSPVREPDACLRKGFSVSADREDMERLPNIRANVSLSVQEQEILRDAMQLEILAKLDAFTGPELRKTARACGFPGLVVGSEIGHDTQFRTFLKKVLESTDPRDKAARDIAAQALNGNKEYVGELVAKAFSLDLLTVADGEYFLDGDHLSDFMCPVSRQGEEIDHLVSLLSVPNRIDTVNRIDVAVQVAEAARQRDQGAWEQHDREIDAAIAAEILYKDTTRKKWMVRDASGGTHELVTIAVGVSKERQLEELKAWARKKSIDKLRETLAALFVE